jgi:hypothetical protein
MNSRESPSIHASDLHTISDDEARALVDELLGTGDTWPSLLVSFRLTDSSQDDWKAEVGHWLHTSGLVGAQEALVTLIHDRARNAKIIEADRVRHADDQSHRILNQVLAEAMVAHYLRGNGWSVCRWEPGKSQKAGDVDLSWRGRGVDAVNIQVKASDSPLVASDARVRDALEKAARQLREFGSARNIIVMCAQRGAPLSQDCEQIGHDLIGSTSQYCGAVLLARSQRGAFDSDAWRHVSAVVLLDYLRGVNEFKYPCTVFLNPWATTRLDESEFPRARVLTLTADGVFRWLRGAPTAAPTIPDGTVLTERGWFEGAPM